MGLKSLTPKTRNPNGPEPNPERVPECPPLVSASLFQDASKSFSSARAAANVSPQDVGKGKNFAVSYLVESLGLTTKLAESISRKVGCQDKGNLDLVLSLFRSHGFTDSQISNIVSDYPQVLIADAECSLAPKLQFLKARGASTSELTVILSKVPKILRRMFQKFKKNPSLLTLSEKNVLNSIEAFLSVGFTRDGLATLVKCHPQCLNYSAEMVKKKTEFLVKEMSWTVKAVVSNPSVLDYSLEKRTIPRCKVIKALMSNGLLGSELPSVGSVLVCTNEMFLERYVMKHGHDKQLVAKLMAIFKGDRVS